MFTIGGKRVVAITQTLSAISASLLKEPVADLSVHRDEITAALDMLLHGF